jgi:hypothetical protein
MSVHEKWGKRCQKVSAFHRKLGKDIYMADIDHFGFEYFNRKPVIFIEYKHVNAKDFTLLNQTATYDALRWIGNQCQIPVLEVRYDDQFDQFTFNAINQNAKDLCKKLARFGSPPVLTRIEFAKFHHWIRNIQIDHEKIEQDLGEDFFFELLQKELDL